MQYVEHILRLCLKVGWDVGVESGLKLTRIDLHSLNLVINQRAYRDALSATVSRMATANATIRL